MPNYIINRTYYDNHLFQLKKKISYLAFLQIQIIIIWKETTEEPTMSNYVCPIYIPQNHETVRFRQQALAFAVYLKMKVVAF